MPAVIVVAILICGFLMTKYGGNDNKAQLRVSVDRQIKKTNARLEKKLFDRYIKDGLLTDDAYKKTCKDMTLAGFFPCIPLDVYRKKKEEDIEEYDSFCVKSRREFYMDEWCKDNGKKEFKGSEKELERFVYKDFPRFPIQYKQEMEQRSYARKAQPIGALIDHTYHGICEVIDHKKRYTTEGTYVLRRINDDEIIYNIRYDDIAIRDTSG